MLDKGLKVSSEKEEVGLTYIIHLELQKHQSFHLRKQIQTQNAQRATRIQWERRMTP